MKPSEWILRGLGILAAAYLAVQAFVWILFTAVSVFGGASTNPPKDTTWFWECRQHEVYGKPFFPAPDFVGKAPDETKCGSKP